MFANLKKPVRLIALDMDGTLCNTEKKISRVCMVILLIVFY